LGVAETQTTRDPEMASVATFMASDAASAMAGRIVNLNMGSLLGRTAPKRFSHRYVAPAATVSLKVLLRSMSRLRGTDLNGWDSDDCSIAHWCREG
jgi:hypothetical protein